MRHRSRRPLVVRTLIVQRRPTQGRPVTFRSHRLAVVQLAVVQLAVVVAAVPVVAAAAQPVALASAEHRLVGQILAPVVGRLVKTPLRIRAIPSRAVVGAAARQVAALAASARDKKRL